VSLLRVDRLTVALPPASDRAEAVSEISLELDPGEILSIVGESGSGKSVCASAIMGLLPADLRIRSGAILFEGRDLLRLPERERRSLRGSRLGMIFQESMTALNPLMRVGDQVAEVLRIHGRWVAERGRQRVAELMDAVHLPDPRRLMLAYPHMLSGGQRQRVMIAIALALEPPLLIADEPTTALDVTTQMRVLRLIREIQSRRGTGVLLITHDFGIVAEVADTVAVMQKGRIVETGRARTVLGAPRHSYTKALIDAASHRPLRAGPAATGDPILELRGLRKTYWRSGGLFHSNRQIEAIRNADLSVARGETLGVVGESGSGKSTLARCLVRLVQPDAGEIRFDGTDLRPLSRSAWKPYRRRIQMIFQDPFASLNPRRQVGDIIAAGPIVHGMPRSQALARATDLLRLVRLAPGASVRLPHQFSGGERQRIGIARALAVEPELLVADEPVSALDVSVQAEILALLADLRERLGLTMLFITHDLRVAAQICDRIAVIQEGTIVEQGLTRQIFQAPRHEYTRALLESIPGTDWNPVVPRAPEQAT
jgi:ABC-type glutathione transport system ATPase component